MKALRAVDGATAALLVIGYVAILLFTVSDLGYARDEGFYFAASSSYERWFELLLTNPREAFLRSTVDRYWAANHEHPALMKSLFALSHRYLHLKWQWISDPGTAFRFPGMVVSALALGVLFLWGRQSIGRLGGFVAAMSYALMPRVFYHSHLCAFDTPVASLWLITAYAYWRAWQSPRRGTVILVGLLYGLLLNTKHNSWLFPGVVGLHWLLTRGGLVWRAVVGSFGARRVAAEKRRLVGARVPLGALSLITIGPLVFYALWPWIWHDTWARLQGYAAFHLKHDYYNMEFLGQTYWKPPMPRLYAWVMTVGTVPAMTLILCVLGVVFAFRERVVGTLARLRGQHARCTVAERQRYETYALWGFSALVSYAPWFSSNTPIFGGTKHWITAYPLLCLFAALGFENVRQKLRSWLSDLRPNWSPSWREPVLSGLLLTSALLGPLMMTKDSHPFALTNYTPLVGGAPGAATLGLNRTFWGYTTGSLQDFLSAEASRNGVVYVHDTALQSFNMLREERRVRADLRGTLDIAAAEIAIYQYETHMSRVEHQIWVDYGTTKPAVVKSHHGVPVVWAYERPIPGGSSTEDPQAER